MRQLLDTATSPSRRHEIGRVLYLLRETGMISFAATAPSSAP